jgi:hypothetical protein
MLILHPDRTGACSPACVFPGQQTGVSGLCVSWTTLCNARAKRDFSDSWQVRRRQMTACCKEHRHCSDALTSVNLNQG